MFIKSEDEKKEHFNKILLIRQKIIFKDFLNCIFYRSFITHSSFLTCDYFLYKINHRLNEEKTFGKRWTENCALSIIFFL